MDIWEKFRIVNIYFILLNYGPKIIGNFVEYFEIYLFTILVSSDGPPVAWKIRWAFSCKWPVVERMFMHVTGFPAQL